MARTTKQLSGGGKDKFLRGLIASEPAIPADIGQRLGDRMCDSIADVRVRRDAWHPATRDEAARQAEHPEPKTSPPTSSKPEAAPTVSAASNAAKPAPAPAPTFDPFSFSALAVLTRQGAGALAAKLEAVAAVADLQALAKAQHLAIDSSLADAPALRKAIIGATEARLAERRAAAS